MVENVLIVVIGLKEKVLTQNQQLLEVHLLVVLPVRVVQVFLAVVSVHLRVHPVLVARVVHHLAVLVLLAFHHRVVLHLLVLALVVLVFHQAVALHSVVQVVVQVFLVVVLVLLAQVLLVIVIQVVTLHH